MSNPSRLTLGALYREMRVGLGDVGWARVTVEFRQRTAGEQASGHPPEEGAGIVLQALVDQRDGVLDRAEVSLIGPPPPRRLTVRRQGDAYVYSIDGRRWGSFLFPPRIFDLGEFERELAQVVVEDATFDTQPARAEAGMPAVLGSPGSASLAMDALDVSLDRAAFFRLLRIFSADLDEDPDDLALTAYSVSLEAAGDVSLLYWWSLGGLDPQALESESPPGPPGPRVSCSVTIRVSPVGAPVSETVTLDAGLPDVGRLDDVWALMRGRPPA